MRFGATLAGRVRAGNGCQEKREIAVSTHPQFFWGSFERAMFLFVSWGTPVQPIDTLVTMLTEPKVGFEQHDGPAYLRAHLEIKRAHPEMCPGSEDLLSPAFRIIATHADG